MLCIDAGRFRVWISRMMWECIDFAELPVGGYPLFWDKIRIHARGAALFSRQVARVRYSFTCPKVCRLRVLMSLWDE